MTFGRASITFAAAALALSSAGIARAAKDCTILNADGTVTLDTAAAGGTFTATPIYIAGSTALEPLIKAAGKFLAAPTQTKPYVLIYDKDGSCSGVNRIATSDGTILNNGAKTEQLQYIPPDYDPAQAPIACTQMNKVTATLILSDVDATLCPGITAQPTSFQDFKGPVNNMVFIVPPKSDVKAISAEMAYLMFGLGDKGQVAPFIDPTAFFIRTNSSGTRAMINAGIGLTTHPWLGDDGTAVKMGGYGSSDVFGKVSAANATATAAQKTIGILGEDFYDGADGNGSPIRNQVHALAFRAFKQHLAYWPDSTLSSRDKKNVREGRYGIWGYVHMLAKVTGSTVTDAAAKYFIDLVQGSLTNPPVNALDLTIAAHLTPVCAMKVTHDIEGAPSKPYSDPAPCGCYFETKATGTTPASCKACPGGDADCAGGTATHCRYGYCEAN